MKSRMLTAAVGVLLVVAAGTSASAIVTNDMTIYYSFDNVGSTVADGSGNGYDGTVHGDVTPAEGIAGGAARFGSLELAYIDVGGGRIDPAHIPTSAFTLAAWVKVDASGDQEIFAARDGTPEDSPVLHAEIRNNGYRFVVRGYNSDTIGDMKSEEADPPVTPVFGEWHHVAMTYDKATAKQALWINGELALEQTVDDPQDMAADWDGGARAGTSAGSGSRPFIGLMDELYIYSRALSPEEIHTLASVPEPTTLAMLAGALVSLLLWRRAK